MSTYVYKEAIYVIGKILASELGLTSPGQVIFDNERWKIPPDNRLYILLTYVGPDQVIGNNNYAVPVQDGGMNEVQEVVNLYQIQIDLMSFNVDLARITKVFVPMALKSIFAQEQEAQYIMQIARAPSGMANTSDLEENVHRLARYTCRINVSQVIRNVKSLGNDYYSDFSRAVPPAITVEA